MESQLSDIESPLLTPTVPKGQPSPFLQPMQHTPIQILSFGSLEIPDAPDAPRKTKRNCDDDNDKSFVRKKLFTENLPFDVKCVRNENYGVVTLTPNQIIFIQKRYEIIIALDKSYSMYGFKLDKLKELLHNIILLLFDISSDKDLEFMITIITYNDSVRIISEVLITKDTNKDEITSVLDKIKYILASGGTNFEDLFNFLKYKNGNFLIITDGEPTSGITNENALVNILNDNDNEGNKYYLLGIGVGPSITFFNKFITNIDNSYYYCLNDVIKELGAYVSEILVNILYNNGAIKLEGNCLFLDIEHNRLSPVHTVHLTTQPIEVVFQCLNEEIQGLDDNDNITCLTQALNITFQNVNHTFRVEETSENIDIHIWRFRVMQLMSSCNELLITNNDKTCLIEQCKDIQEELVKYITDNNLESNLIIIQQLDHIKMCLYSFHTKEVKQAQIILYSRLHSEYTQSRIMIQNIPMSYDCHVIDFSKPSCLGTKVISAYYTLDSIANDFERMLLEKE